MIRGLIAGLVVAVIAFPLSIPASALPIDAAVRSPASGLVNVEFRGHYGRYHHRYGGRRFGGGYYGSHRGFGLGAGIAGLAAGAIIGGAIANAAPSYQANSSQYCANRFRSYDPESGTYLGYDGLRHSCP